MSRHFKDDFVRTSALRLVRQWLMMVYLTDIMFSEGTNKVYELGEDGNQGGVG